MRRSHLLTARLISSYYGVVYGISAGILANVMLAIPICAYFRILGFQFGPGDSRFICYRNSMPFETLITPPEIAAYSQSFSVGRNANGSGLQPRDISQILSFTHRILGSVIYRSSDLLCYFNGHREGAWSEFGSTTFSLECLTYVSRSMTEISFASFSSPAVISLYKVPHMSPGR